MSSNGASFLPRLESVFYAVFDVDLGPKIISQVPEGLIATSSSSGHASGASSSTLYTASPASSTPSLADLDPPSRHPSTSVLSSPTTQRLETRSLLSPTKSTTPGNRFFFTFDDISKYVIPPKALCGRLVICAAKSHRVLGLPVRLDEEYYPRNYFLYNKESRFLSSPDSAPAIHAVLEQLYEDLNSYSETSIPIDRFNSIELKIFPFYPNPPPVKDWMVPLALINLTNRIEPNWDLTIVKICPYIDGTNHISRIARLANCDLNLTRLAISHLLYYQVIMLMDIFQYSNMYTLRKSIQWLAGEEHIIKECGPYVTKPAGKTVRDWMEEFDVHKLGIDVRRFTSFGVIKASRGPAGVDPFTYILTLPQGFLRRVHRWPIILPNPAEQPPDRRATMASLGRKRGKSFASTNQPPASSPPTRAEQDSLRVRARMPEAQPTIASAGAEIVAISPSATRVAPTRRVSAAESSLEQLRTRDGRKPLQDKAYQTMSRLYPRASEAVAQNLKGPERFSHASTRYISSSSPDALASALNAEPLESEHSSGGRSTTLGLFRPRTSLSCEPSHGMLQGAAPFPAELLPWLDGEHHTDEICTHYEVGWPVLRQWLFAAGGGEEGSDEYGRISIIYR
ncbi:Nitrogen permease regulator 2 -like protein [Trametes pubescens]|uniref:Nitrogen permease regulator 2-like protein n=1 Tax=Trametes pubescens TaxID=154538 RepID=A0A1M2VJU8_TRAPU|nr:Nitrogen permease regulator 2 -like protein [Trametes pubescens]